MPHKLYIPPLAADPPAAAPAALLEALAERFRPDPLGPPGARLYRTGDRARWRPDGQLEFLGRLDDQVKVRGYRIEPGEVETVLAGHPAVRQAAVLARPDAEGAPQLVAYVTGEPVDLRPHLAERLPAYLMPTRYVWLDALPLTRNGKLDVAALPGPAAPASPAASAAARPTAELAAVIWAEALGLAAVGLDDDVFDLGAHSLLAMKALTRIREAFGVNLVLRNLFEQPSVAQLAPLIDLLLSELTAGRLAPVVARTFSLDHVADAHRFIQSRGNIGKVVLTV